ncbi:SusC/RagA family TonB-linked outer membrane protein [Arsenicibacter rosenii]|uniref:SusC/RagA family TonB-linked outer membrane protein n=1 Tax=Arsenicibacter rosenii TaxID=1750698 RepID=A0A1S2VI03_9BACT|nr:SusC/RagA family TonB-linked outer membrane protein [Arsenicibacter rosenii]OIN58384.1 SusC/RagA family TonB-linked outer membrane protein [Arsenicibacter rosenii]
MQKLLHKWLFALLAVALTTLQVMAQERTISGRVTSAEDNTPIPGANVVVKGTTRGTTTDANGRFTISANAGQTLRISFIGTVPQEIQLGNATSLNVSLKAEASSLNEVVVTALGIKREKRQLGYAVTEVNGADLANSQRDNFINALQGRVAGLQVGTSSGMPGASSGVIIRGVNSISGNNQPLYVIDGMPIDNRTAQNNQFVAGGISGQSFENRNIDFSNRAQDINPNDIETITVLKGPEAAALYGVEAANGAIVITTKKGKAGQGRITYSATFTSQQVGPLPETQRVYSQGVNGSANNTSFTAFGPKYAETTQFYNNADGFLRDGTGQRHNISFDGGSERVTYRLSAGYFNSKGVIPTTEYKRLNVSLGGTAKISNKFSVESTLQYINTDNQKVSKGTNSFLLGLLSWPANDDMASYLNPDGSRRKVTTGSSEIENPYFDVYKNKLQDKGNRAITNVGVNFTPTDWLTLTGRVGLDVYSTQYLFMYHPESNRAGGVIGGSLDQATDNNRTFTTQYFATAKKNFGKLSSSLRVGQAIYDYNYNSLASRGEKFLDPNFVSINNTDPLTQKSKNFIRQRRLIGVFGDLTLGYNDVAFLTVTGRNDWSSTFPKASRSFFYPSASFSLIYTDLLPAGKFKDVLSYGKFRISAAQVGKEAPEYSTSQAYESQTTTGGGFSYGFTAPNPYLVPEKVTSFEVGTEMKFFNNRLGVDLAYYKTTSVNQIIRDLRISYATGFILKTINGGRLWNNGVELSINGEPIRTKDLTWNIAANFTKTNSRLAELPSGQSEFYNSDTWIYGNVRNGMRLGGTLTTLTGNSYMRNANGDILISPLTGLPFTETVWNVVGDRNPDFVIGLVNNLTYKNVGLSFVLDIRKGGDVYNATESYLFRNGLSMKTLDREQPLVFKGVLKDGLENTATPTPNNIQIIPYYNTAYYSGLSDQNFIERDVNWVRLKEITLRYSLPNTLLARTKLFKTANLFVTGNDLFILTNYTGGDPGVNGANTATGGSGGQGIDFGNLPLPRVFNVGINIGL